ncbi:MAG TPA: alpha/beta hydrolase domain-containing protein [Bryobacteraceae bacterium]|jgi:hypothetical protein
MNRGFVAFLGCAAALMAETVPVPKVTKLPVTADSRPLGAANHTLEAVDLAKLGYVEDEFIVSGTANVYDWNVDGTVKVKIPNAPYANRILVRHPADPKKFSGAVMVEIMNAARKFDWGMMLGYLGDHMLERGDAWVGVTQTASLDGLKKFNPARYAALSFANPNPTESCVVLDARGGGKNAPPSTSPMEEGLKFDMLSQVAAALKSTAAGAPMAGFKVDAVYMTTQAGDIVTYINAIHPRATLASGKPAYDGYLIKNVAAAAKIRNCGDTPGKGDPRGPVKDVNVPVIAMVAQGEVVAGLATARPDSEKYRRYEIAGAAHIDKYAYASLPSFPDQIAASGTAQGDPSWPFTAKCDPDIPLSGQTLLKYTYNAALDNLDNWVRKGVAAPKADRIKIKDGASAPEIALDQFGNGLGGIRNPWVDVPVAKYETTSPGPGTCAELGHTLPLNKDRLKSLYVTPQDYGKKVALDVDKLVKEHWFTESDGKKIKAELVAQLGK